jgi:hypothetical protein
MNKELMIELADIIRRIGNFIDQCLEMVADNIEQQAETTDEERPTVRRRQQ